MKFKVSFVCNFILTFIIAGLLTYFVILGKGITVDQTSVAISNSYASSGSFSIGYIGGDYRGNWIIEHKDFSSGKDLIDILDSLSPLQFMNVQIHGYTVFYPSIDTSFDETHDKMINGKVIH